MATSNQGAADPADFEIMKNALYKIAEEMRVVLAKTAYSPILKSAGDYSCGVFDAAGFGMHGRHVGAKRLEQCRALPGLGGDDGYDMNHGWWLLVACTAQHPTAGLLQGRVENTIGGRCSRDSPLQQQAAEMAGKSLCRGRIQPLPDEHLDAPQHGAQLLRIAAARNRLADRLSR